MTKAQIRTARLHAQAGHADIVSVVTTLGLLDSSGNAIAPEQRELLADGVATKLKTAIVCLQAALLTLENKAVGP